MRCMLEPDECGCDCHNAPEGVTISHIAPCCHECPHCRKNIIIVAFDAHVAYCKEKNPSSMEGVLIRRPALLNCPFCGRRIDDFSYQMHLANCRRNLPVPPINMV